MTSIVEVIQHYQRSIDSSQDNEARLLHCINKLYKLPIKVEHLQETGVGKTVNSLRKFNGEIGVAAKTLVTKWKAMVAAEEEPMATNSQTTDNDANGGDGGAAPHNDESDEHQTHKSTEQKHEHKKRINDDNNDKRKENHKSSSSHSSNGNIDKSKNSASNSSDNQNIEKSSKNSHDKHKSSSKSSKEKHSSSSRSNPKDKEREKEKSDHKSSRDKHKERHHEKDKERSDKHRHENSKSSREHKLDSPNSDHSSQLNSNCHTSSSKSKHEEKPSRSSSSKEKERSHKHKSSSKDKERTKDEKQSSQSTSSKDKHEHTSISTSSTSKSVAKDPDSVERKRSHNSDNDTIDFKSPPPKMIKLHKSSSSTTASRGESSPSLVADGEEVADDCFDSSMGANFDDVLGMLNIPSKKSKKSLKSPSTPSNNSSSTSKKDALSHKQQTTSSSSSIMSNKATDTRMSFTSNSSNLYSTPSTSKASTMKPDLLAPTAKLEPLDPNIALELPIISTNYKPMPLNQTVMDCVFNNASSSSKPVRTLTDAEAITHGISSKTMRTKIYSGVRTGQTFQVPSLFDMCIRLLQKNIDALEYTGGVPFEVLKPVLERATPQQLYIFEEYNPYLMEDSDVLWQQHVSRNYRTKKRIENESWREMFIRCQEEEERRLSVLKDSIKASQKIAAAPVRKTQLAFVDSMVKPPRNVLKKQEQFGTKAKLVATPAARVASLSSVTPNCAKTGDQRLKVISAVRDHAQVSTSSIRPKKAPLMQKTLQFIRGRHKR